MSVASQVRGVRRTAIHWTGLTAIVLLASCGGDRRESPDAVAVGTAATDTTQPPTADTMAVATADTTAPAATDTSTVKPNKPPTPTPPAVPKPAASAPKPATPAPKPAAPAPTARTTPAPETPAAVPAQDTGVTARDTAESAPTAGPPGEASGESQTAGAPLRDAYHQAPKDTVDQATYDGWKQFNLNCARCHGEDVLGTTIAPHLLLSLKPDGPINTQEAFVQVVCAGRPEKGMPSWCALGMDPAKINQMYSYVKGRSDGKIGPGRPAVKPEG